MAAVAVVAGDRSGPGADVQHFLTAETNEDMKRMINVTVGRLATPKEKQKVSREDFVDYIRVKQVKETDCWNFPFVILYFVMFAVTVLFHEDIPNVSQVERLMRGMMEGTGFEGVVVSGHKSLDDIDVPSDIWLFLLEAAVPWFIPDLSATLPKDANRVMRYNQLIGGVQLQQIRRARVNCVDEYPDLGPFRADTKTNPLLEGFKCYPYASKSNTCFGPLMDPSLGYRGSTSCPLPQNASQAKPPLECEGWCPDPKPDSASSSARLLHDDIYDSLHGLGRRLASATNAAKVKGNAQYILTSGPVDYSGGVYTVSLHEHEGINAAKAKIEYMRANDWIDTKTSWFGMKVFVLNPDLAVFTHMTVNVFMPPSGQFLPQVTVQSFPAEPYQSSSKLAADFVWGMLWLHLTVMTTAHLAMAVMHGEIKKYFLNVWNWLNWLTIIGGMIIIGLWFVFLGRLQKIKDMAMDVVLARPVPGTGFLNGVAQEADYYTSTDDLHNEAAKMSGFLMLCRLFVCWYTILIMFRFFQAFKAQPRLAVVTNTITQSLTDLAHFIVVLIVVILAYTVAGMFLFGHRLLDFSETSTALNTCLLIMIGDFDFAELAAEHPLTAVLWFWSYTILVALIMLNMLLAIIMDVYAEVKQDAHEEDPIWSQFYNTAADTWKNRDWIKLKQVASHIERLPSKVTEIDKDLLLELCPEMVEEQAIRLIKDTLKAIEHKENKGMSISDAMKMVGWIKIAVQKIARRIEDILIVEKEEKDILASVGLQQGGAGKSGKLPEHTASFDPAADQKMQAVEMRLKQMETFLNESMCHSVYRAKEMRNRLNVIEDLLQGQANVIANNIPGAAPSKFDEWDAPPAFANFNTRSQLQESSPQQAITFSA